jgi:hypothetical protein
MLKQATTLLIAGALSFGFVACHGSGGDDDESQACIMCEVGGVRCYYSGTYYDICAPDLTLAAITCSEGNGVWEALPLCSLAPSETGDGSGSEPWDPSGNVTFDRVAGEYVIDQQAFEELKRDPTPLLDDSSKLRQLESGYYEVAETGELTQALGWSKGDVLLAVDGHPLRGLDALASLYPELADNTAFELTIQRERAEVVLRYRVE